MAGVLLAVGIAALAVGAVALVARYVPSTNRAVLAVASLACYLMLGAPVAVILFAAQGNWALAGTAGVVTIAVLAVQLPWYVPEKTAAGTSVRVVSANLRYGRAEPEALVQMARAHADILAVQELTPELADAISAAGIADEFPHRVLRACEGPAGVGIWSRYPAERGAVYDGYWLGMLTARVRMPDADVTVVATHMSAPWPDPIAGWRADLARLPETLRHVAATAGGPVVVAGDLNATRDHVEFRRVLRDGYRDAAEQAGAGLTRTHPDDVPMLPPVFALDHILTRDCVATKLRTQQIAGSDHRALLADIAITARGTTS